MEATEIDTFIRKFYQLWNSGHTAHLDIDTCAGKAWVGLRLQLDHAPAGHQHQPAYHQKRFSASRQRRRIRRAAAHAANTHTHAHAEEASEKSTNNGDVNTTAKKVFENVDHGNKEVETEEVEAEEVVVEETEAEEVVVEETEAEEVEVEEVEAERVQVKQVEAEEVETEDAKEESPETTSVNEVGNENSVIVENSDNGVKCPDIIPVYCIATLENCPDSSLNEEYGESIRRFLLSEQHLVQNISSVDLQHLSSRSFRNNSHTHTVSVTIHVRTTRLWESPSNYVRKHLGLANYWERSNGTIVKLSRIHQK